MSPVQKKKKEEEEDKGKVAEYNNKHCRDRMMDRMCTHHGRGGGGVAGETQEEKGN